MTRSYSKMTSKESRVIKELRNKKDKILNKRVKTKCHPIYKTKIKIHRKL